MPISPSSSPTGTPNPIQTTPLWMPHPQHKIPSYILCIPIKVYPNNLRRFEDSVQLDAENLEKLRLYLLPLGDLIANAEFMDLEEEEEDDDDDGLDFNYGFMNRIVRWDEIVL